MPRFPEPCIQSKVGRRKFGGCAVIVTVLLELLLLAGARQLIGTEAPNLDTFALEFRQSKTPTDPSPALKHT